MLLFSKDIVLEPLLLNPRVHRAFQKVPPPPQVYVDNRETIDLHLRMLQPQLNVSPPQLHQSTDSWPGVGCPNSVIILILKQENNLEANTTLDMTRISELNGLQGSG